MVPEGLWKRWGVRGCRVPGTRGRVESVQDGKCKMPLFSQKRSIISPQTEVLGWRGGARGRGADPPGRGTPRKPQACQCQRPLGLPWSSSMATSIFFFFLTNTIKLILSWDGALKKLPFLWVERRVSHSFTSSPKTTGQTCGASRGHLVFKGCLRFSLPVLWLHP